MIGLPARWKWNALIAVLLGLGLLGTTAAAVTPGDQPGLAIMAAAATAAGVTWLIGRRLFFWVP